MSYPASLLFFECRGLVSSVYTDRGSAHISSVYTDHGSAHISSVYADHGSAHTITTAAQTGALTGKGQEGESYSAKAGQSEMKVSCGGLVMAFLCVQGSDMVCPLKEENTASSCGRRIGAQRGLSFDPEIF